MTPKEKAEDLLLQYSILSEGNNHLVKQCVLIAVDEIIQAIIFTDAKSDLGHVGYWQKVKQEI